MMEHEPEPLGPPPKPKASRAAPPVTDNCVTERSYRLHLTREDIQRIRKAGNRVGWWAETMYAGESNEKDLLKQHQKELVDFDLWLNAELQTLGGPDHGPSKNP